MNNTMQGGDHTISVRLPKTKSAVDNGRATIKPLRAEKGHDLKITIRAYPSG